MRGAVKYGSGGRSYTFVYSQEKLPHLMAIASQLIGKELFISYGGQQLSSPFDGTSLELARRFSMLQIEKGRNIALHTRK